MVKANPNIDEESLFWRLHFALGAFVFATVSSRALNEIASSKFEQDSDLLNIIEQAIPYISAGLETDNPQVNCETQQKD
ncbi:predicted transcriptional regulator for fatty acid degradation FadQ TetR family [Vibrio variabilis]|nr:predicted transcriptional regulator for fatty acid degradation FadQ TetR family [Vibrio variabilis]